MLPCYILNIFAKNLGPLEDKFTPRLTIDKVCEIYFLLSSQFSFSCKQGNLLFGNNYFVSKVVSLPSCAIYICNEFQTMFMTNSKYMTIGTIPKNNFTVFGNKWQAKDMHWRGTITVTEVVQCWMNEPKVLKFVLLL
jgi:hypothetical protein